MARDLSVVQIQEQTQGTEDEIRAVQSNISGLIEGCGLFNSEHELPFEKLLELMGTQRERAVSIWQARRDNTELTFCQATVIPALEMTAAVMTADALLLLDKSVIHNVKKAIDFVETHKNNAAKASPGGDYLADSYDRADKRIKGWKERAAKLDGAEKTLELLKGRKKQNSGNGEEKDKTGPQPAQAKQPNAVNDANRLGSQARASSTAANASPTEPPLWQPIGQYSVNQAPSNFNEQKWFESINYAKARRSDLSDDEVVEALITHIQKEKAKAGAKAPASRPPSATPNITPNRRMQSSPETPQIFKHPSSLSQDRPCSGNGPNPREAIRPMANKHPSALLARNSAIDFNPRRTSSLDIKQPAYRDSLHGAKPMDGGIRRQSGGKGKLRDFAGQHTSNLVRLFNAIDPVTGQESKVLQHRLARYTLLDACQEAYKCPHCDLISPIPVSNKEDFRCCSGCRRKMAKEGWIKPEMLDPSKTDPTVSQGS